MSEGSDRRRLPISELLQQVKALCQGLRVESREQDLADHFVKIVDRLLEDHRIAVRLVNPATGNVSVVAAMRSSVSDLTSAPIAVGERPYRPLLSDDGAGFCVPLRVEGELVGVINVERDQPYPEAENDRQVVDCLATLLTATIRNRRVARGAKFIRDRLAKIIDHAHAMIFVMDSQRRVSIYNRELADLTGYAAKEIMGRDVLEWIPKAHHLAFERAFARALAGEPVSGFEVTLHGKEGHPIRTIVNMARPADTDDPGAAVVAIGQDVTAMKQLEHQVIQADKLASLGQLAAGVVHEINNPLTSITVYADYLVKKFTSTKAEPADVAKLEKILEGSNRILKFARDLVDYAKPSVEQLDVLSLNEIVQQSISFCEHTLRQANATLEIELASELVPFYGVKDQLQQVLINLITNSCHSLGSDGGAVKIRTMDLGSGNIAVEITDSGQGIESSDLPHIFDPFFTTKAPGEGTGLGLSIVKKIVDLHDGSIMVQSQPDAGTVFCVTFPTGNRPQGMQDE